MDKEDIVKINYDVYKKYLLLNKKDKEIFRTLSMPFIRKENEVMWDELIKISKEQIKTMINPEISALEDLIMVTRLGRQSLINKRNAFLKGNDLWGVFGWWNKRSINEIEEELSIIDMHLYRYYGRLRDLKQSN